MVGAARAAGTDPAVRSGRTAQVATDPEVQDREVPDQPARWGHVVRTDLVARVGPVAVARMVQVRVVPEARVAPAGQGDQEARADRAPNATPDAPPRPSAS